MKTAILILAILLSGCMQESTPVVNPEVNMVAGDGIVPQFRADTLVVPGGSVNFDYEVVGLDVFESIEIESSEQLLFLPNREQAGMNFHRISLGGVQIRDFVIVNEGFETVSLRVRIK